MGLMAGPDKSAESRAQPGRRVRAIDRQRHKGVHQGDRVRAESAAARASGSIRATLGESFTISGRRARVLHRRHHFAPAVPDRSKKYMPPCLVLGQETFSS